MPLGARELLLVLRARDEASRAVHALGRSMNKMDKDAEKAANKHAERGRALSSLGVGIAAVGGAGAMMLADFAKEAIAYNQAASKTHTQLDKVTGSIADLKKIGMEVGAAIPVAFDQIQSSLFDIFSSMDTDLKGAQHLLTEFSKAAVAGQEDLQDTARGTIGILNAYRMEAKDVNRVNDVMFQLVRKGVGTYGEFSKTIGRSVPSAVRAGQSVEDLAGMLAFLTRNGLSTAMASASAGRALDAMSNPKVVGRLEKMGVAVKGANGEFRPMSQIMTELGKKMATLTAPERAEALQELFKGAGGTIQARRFFDIAVKNFTELNALTKDMHNSKGAMEDAYNTMFVQPQSQIQLFNNNLQILKITIGDALLPIVNDMLKQGIKLIQWFQDLSPRTQKFIAWTLLLASALAIITGVVLIAAGALAIMAAAAAALGITLGTLLLIIGIVIVVIIAIAVAVYFIIKYWDPIKKFFIDLWNDIKDWTIRAWNATWDFLVMIWNKIWGAISGFVEMYINIWKFGLNAIWETAKFIWNAIVATAKAFWNAFITLIKINIALFLTPFIFMFNYLKSIWDWFWDTAIGKKLIYAWNAIVNFTKNAINQVILLFKTLFDTVRDFVVTWFTWLINSFMRGFNIVKDIVLNALNWIRQRWLEGFNIVRQYVTQFFTAVWRLMTNGWNVVKSIWNTAADAVYRVTMSVVDRIKGVFNRFWEHLSIGFGRAKESVSRIWGSIREPLTRPVNFVIEWVWNKGIAKAWNTAADLVGLGGKFKAPMLSPIKYAQGGLVGGKSGIDKNLALLTRGEMVVNREATREYLPLLQAINNGKRVPGFRKGGLIGDGLGDMFGRALSPLTGVLGKAKDFAFETLFKFGEAAFKPVRALIDRIPGGGAWTSLMKAVPNKILDGMLNFFKKKDSEGGYIGGGSLNGMGWKAQWAAVKNQFPWAILTSSVRPGAITATGNVSNHAKGRAIDVAGGNMMAIFNWIVAKYGKKSLEVIFSPAGNRQMYKGKPHYYPEPTRGDHWDHVHWAYDQGGYLMPGVRMAANFTGQRERVLDPEETKAYEQGKNVTVNVFTQEINPRFHAEQLGWELARQAS